MIQLLTKLLQENNLTPDIIYFFYLIREKDICEKLKDKKNFEKSIKNISDFLEIRKDKFPTLILDFIYDENYIKLKDEDKKYLIDNIQINTRGNLLLSKFNIKKSNVELEKLVENYVNLFPAGIKSGNYYVKSSPKSVSRKMMLFLREYDYDDETILNATKMYVDNMSLRNYEKMRTCYNFIIKDGVSDLASYCENYLNSDKSDINNDWVEKTF